MAACRERTLSKGQCRIDGISLSTNKSIASTVICYNFPRALSADLLKLGQLTEMRKNLHPEWGYLTPAPSFIRPIPMVLLGTVIGARASGEVVFSLVDRPASQTSVLARTWAPPVQAAPAPVSAPETEQPNPRAAVQNESTKSGANGHLESAAAPVTPGRALIGVGRATAIAYTSPGRRLLWPRRWKTRRSRRIRQVIENRPKATMAGRRMAGATGMPRSCDINVLGWQRSLYVTTGAKGHFGALATAPRRRDLPPERTQRQG